MKVVSNKNTINITELVDRINFAPERIIVFYKTSDKPVGLPVFLKTNRSRMRFISPIAEYPEVYLQSPNERTYNYLQRVSSERQLYVVHKDDAMEELFRVV